MRESIHNFSINFEYDPKDPGWMNWAFVDDSGEITTSGNDPINDIPNVIGEIINSNNH